MSEARFWKYLRENIDWRAIRLECNYLGIADVYFKIDVLNNKGEITWISGWIELKQRQYPKDKSLRIKIKHFTSWQKKFLREEGRTGSPAWLFLRIEREYFLIDWLTAQKIDELTYGDLENYSFGYWKNKIDFDELRGLLTRTMEEK